MSKIASRAIYDNWRVLSLLSEQGLSKRLYSTLLDEKPSIVKALAKLLYNASLQVFTTTTKLKKPLRKSDLKVLTDTKGSITKKRRLLSRQYYRKSVIPTICEAALKYLDGGRKGNGKDSVE